MLGYTGNSEELQVLVDVVEGMDLDGIYTEATVKAVRDALDAAKEVLANENALQDEIDAAKAALQEAVDALERIPVDKSKLEKLVASAAKYEEKIDQYTPVTAEAFTAALEGAREVLANENATQEEVDAAYAALQNAIFGLREIPNKDKLAELLKKAEGLDLTKYTAQSVGVLRTAMAKAQMVLANENATEDDVKAATEELETAIDKLEKTTVKPSTDDNKTDSNKTDTDKGKKVTKTGDTAPIVVWGLVLILALGCIAFVCVRRRRQR